MGRNVYLQPSLASQGVKGTVTNALASAFVGSLGGGKSFCNNLLVYYAVLFGGQALLLDPKSERGNWKETLPEIAHEINIVNLTSDKDNAGLLDPFVIMKNYIIGLLSGLLCVAPVIAQNRLAEPSRVQLL